MQLPHPPIAISIMSPNSGSALMAGERGWIPISGASFLQPRYTGSHWEKYQEGAERAGRAADPAVWRVSRSIVVADSDQAAYDYIMNPDGPIAFWYQYLLSSLQARGLVKFIAPDGHPNPDEVTWQEVWGKLNTAKIHAQGLSHRAHREGFSEAWHALNENVSIAK